LEAGPSISTWRPNKDNSGFSLKSPPTGNSCPRHRQFGVNLLV
jgi:hypothetical protein